jgi:hypothetical protein
MRRKREDCMEEGCKSGEITGELDVIEDLNNKMIKMPVSGDFGALAYLQALQNMNLLTQDLMRKSMGSSSNGINKEDIKDIVREVVISIMKELGAKVE